MNSDVQSFPPSPALSERAWPIADQVLLAGTNFAIAVLLARQLTVEHFGLFTLVYALLLFANGIQSGLIAQPHNVLGAARGGEEYLRYTSATALSQAVLAVCGALLVLLAAGGAYAGGWSMAPVLLAAAPTLLAWQVQEFLRRILYTENRPAAAFTHDLLGYGGALLILGSLWWMRALTAPRAMYALAVGFAIAATVSGWMLRSRFGRTLEFAFVRENWQFGKWLAARHVVGEWLYTQLLVFLAAAAMGAAAAGVLRAVHTLFGPARILAQVLNITLPIRLARALASHGDDSLRAALRTTSLVALPLLGAYCALVAAFAAPLLSLVFGQQYAGYEHVLRLYAISAFLGYAVALLAAALKAQRRTRQIFLSEVVSLLVLPVGVLLIPVWGLAGVVVGLIAGDIVLIALLWSSYSPASVLELLPRFRRARRELSALAAREQWSRDQIEALQLDRLNAIWRHAIDHVPYYRRLHHDSKLPRQFESLADALARIPVLDKSQVIAHRDEFLSERARRGAWHRTSGSTGTPVRIFREHEAHREMLRAKYRFYATWGLDIFDRTAWVWSTIQATQASSLRDRLRRRIRLDASKLGRDELREFLKRMEQFAPVALYGFSRAVYLLAMEARAIELRCPCLKFVCLTGEAASETIKRTVARAFGVPVIMEYGSVECGYLAGQWPDGTLRVRDDIALLETLPRADGMFDICVSVLNNASFPLLRYKIGDVTDSPLRRPDTGFAMLSSVVGRSDDVLLARSGRFVHSACVDELFERHFDAAVARYRVHQDEAGAISAMVDLREPGAGFDASDLAARLTELVEGYPVEVRLVRAMPQTEAGKHRLVTSDLGHAVGL